ncbi:sigma-70 family RNA polymerase sigma factor [Streptantibioticus parmotrematis]|nr:sigma-70 family RNA polymerase sigma factor [Streptantibioticus parmotrematis]
MEEEARAVAAGGGGAPIGPGALAGLLAAEAAAEACAAGVDPADLEQAVWLRLLDRGPGPPPGPDWLRAAVRAEVRGARRRALREVPYEPGHGPDAPSAENHVLDAERRLALRAAVARLPGRCPRLLSALLSRSDLTYREISRELGISQGSLGPLRSRCLACLRVMLGAEG